jgi:hypothetical protein
MIQINRPDYDLCLQRARTTASNRFLIHAAEERLWSRGRDREFRSTLAATQHRPQPMTKSTPGEGRRWEGVVFNGSLIGLGLRLKTAAVSPCVSSWCGLSQSGIGFNAQIANIQELASSAVRRQRRNPVHIRRYWIAAAESDHFSGDTSYVRNQQMVYTSKTPRRAVETAGQSHWRTSAGCV